MGRPIRIEIFPEYGRASNRLEGDTRVLTAVLSFFCVFITLNDIAPSRVSRLIDPREVGAASGTFIDQVHHEGGHPVAHIRTGIPVVVECVIAVETVSLHFYGLYLCAVVAPPHDPPSAALNPTHNIRPLNGGGLGDADARVNISDFVRPQL